MKFSAAVLALSALAAGAKIQQRAAYDATATVSPFLAPACQLSDIVTEALCKFPELPLAANKCQDVTYPCKIHPPTSFVAQLGQATSKSCYIAVFPDFGCSGDEVDSGALTTTKSGCTEAPYFNKLLTGGILSSSSLLPFGFKSAKLVCN
ncbi:hypothetical protein Cob_v012887 [Colletotrichum orbiculare MAFF 240422]|uniref:Uncharacterized protein n=1 Tax=Colletotrichum orbiculare (strain 104-T / ATCC 96160 / CBS 514.97 / LARS 414 / MAFF 240422) TaxID=1213857 RepID=N4V7J8_COLOR|nr:hypothetical protein Cob_v012887 [Colletotrichum orbiculare MAFF 240422]